MNLENSRLAQIKVAVVDDHELVREGVCQILSANGVSDIERFGTGMDLIRSLENGSDFGFFVVDLELPDIDGFALIEFIRQRNKDARIIVSTVHDEIWTLRRLLSCNVNAIIYKSAGSGEFLKAIEEILDGSVYYCREVREVMGIADDKSLHPSSREMEVLSLIAAGKTTREIADALFVSENTVEAHRKALLSKLGAVNVVDLIMKSIAKGYVNRVNQSSGKVGQRNC